MMQLRLAGLLTCFLLALLSTESLAQSATVQPPAPPDAVTAPAAKIIGVPVARKYSAALIVLNAQGAELSGRTLTLNGAASSAILFGSRPVRTAGHLPTSELVDLWTSGSFAKDPPNATVSVFRKDGSGVSDAVVTLKSPKLTMGKSGPTITFDVDVLESSLAKADGPVAVFIDTIWFGLGQGGFTYYGRNSTGSGGQDSYPAVGNYEQQQDLGPGWVRPSPNGPAVRPSYSQGNAMPNYNPGLAAPPPDTSRACGKPPLLPCY